MMVNFKKHNLYYSNTSVCSLWRQIYYMVKHVYFLLTKILAPFCPLNAKREYLDICPFREVVILTTNITPSLISWVVIYEILYHLNDR